MSFYSSRHYRRVSPPADTQADIADRRVRILASARAIADRLERFPQLTGENADAAIQYQDERFLFWVAGLKQQETSK